MLSRSPDERAREMEAEAEAEVGVEKVRLKFALFVFLFFMSRVFDPVSGSPPFLLTSSLRSPPAPVLVVPSKAPTRAVS